MSQQDENLMSRRKLVGDLGAGIATVAAATTSSFAKATTAARGNAKLEDPTTKYPCPPFAVQPQ